MCSSTFVDATGRPSFQALHHWSTAGLSIVYYAFDLLHLNGRDLLREPLDARRAALAGIVDDSGVLLSDALPGSARQIESAVRRLQLEGVVAKRRRSIYKPTSRTSHWGEGISAEEMTELRWVKPVLVAEISFVEWTRDGSLRHAAFLGLRDDKPPREVRREVSG